MPGQPCVLRRAHRAGFGFDRCDASTSRNRHGARIAEHPFEGYGPQKQRAIDLARHDWILLLDADEHLTDARPRSASSASLHAPRADGYRLPRQEWLFWRWPHPATRANWQLRLFRKSRGRMNDVPVHAAPVVDGARRRPARAVPPLRRTAAGRSRGQGQPLFERPGRAQASPRRPRARRCASCCSRRSPSSSSTSASATSSTAGPAISPRARRRSTPSSSTRRCWKRRREQGSSVRRTAVGLALEAAMDPQVLRRARRAPSLRSRPSPARCRRSHPSTEMPSSAGDAQRVAAIGATHVRERDHRRARQARELVGRRSGCTRAGRRRARTRCRRGSGPGPARTTAARPA